MHRYEVKLKTKKTIILPQATLKVSDIPDYEHFYYKLSKKLKKQIDYEYKINWKDPGSYIAFAFMFLQMLYPGFFFGLMSSLA